MNKISKMLAVVVSAVVIFSSMQPVDAVCLSDLANCKSGNCIINTSNCSNGICLSDVLNCSNGNCLSDVQNCKNGNCLSDLQNCSNGNCLSDVLNCKNGNCNANTQNCNNRNCVKGENTGCNKNGKVAASATKQTKAKTTTKKTSKKTSKKKTSKKKSSKKSSFSKKKVNKKTTSKENSTSTKKTTTNTTTNANVEKTTKDTNSNNTTNATSNEESEYVKQVVDLVNKERVSAGLNKVTLDSTLTKAAMTRAKETVTSFSHTRPNGTSFSTVLSEYNISYRGAGENIAWGQKSPQEVMTGWMNSAGHRANILNANYKKIGVGYYKDANGRKYWSQLFIY